MELMKKRTSKAFGKKLFLIGMLDNNRLIWLEEESWDCDWYWGFGYLETYVSTRSGKPTNSPEHAVDIGSHEHVNSYLFKKVGEEYIYHFNDHPEFKKTVLTDSESWKLADLFKSFYTLKDTAAFFRHGGSHLSSPNNADQLKDPKMEDHINKQVLPEIFTEIKIILSP